MKPKHLFDQSWCSANSGYLEKEKQQKGTNTLCLQKISKQKLEFITELENISKNIFASNFPFEYLTLLSTLLFLQLDWSKMAEAF